MDMSIVLGVGIAVTTITTIYFGKKGWQALHNAVGITPGVLIYQDSNTPLSLSNVKWQQLNLDNNHLKCLSDHQLRQLQRIDEKVFDYQTYQKELQAQKMTSVTNEQQFVLNKMLQIRLPEMLASHHLANFSTSSKNINSEKKVEASELLEQVLNNIEQRLDVLLDEMEMQHLQDLRVMKNYIDSHDS